MRKFGKFILDCFTKNLGYKLLAVVLAAVMVILVNL